MSGNYNFSHGFTMMDTDQNSLLTNPGVAKREGM